MKNWEEKTGGVALSKNWNKGVGIQPSGKARGSTPSTGDWVVSKEKKKSIAMNGGTWLL